MSEDLATMRIANGIVYFVFGTHTQKITGFDKLINQVLKYLLTEEGSDPYDKSYGTVLTSIVGTTPNDEAYLTEVLEESLEKTLNYFEEKRTKAVIAGNSLPDDETLGKLEALGTEINVDSFDIYVNITNNLGDSTTVKLNVS